MVEVAPDEPLLSLMEYLRKEGVVVDYVLLKPETALDDLEQLHRVAADTGMAVVSERVRHYRSLTYQADKSESYHEASFIQEYWYAFSQPPYPLRLPDAKIANAFVELNHLLFPDLEMWSIRRWSDNWSNYFDAGLEWWGAFLWTLVSPDRKSIVWIGASATD